VARTGFRLFKGEPVRAITCNLSTSRDDVIGNYEGGGSQIELALATINFARVQGLTYVHTPLRNIDHLPVGMAMADWASQWENLFCLGKDRAVLVGDGTTMRPAPFNWEVFIELDLFALLGVQRPANLSPETVQLAKNNFAPNHPVNAPRVRTIAVHVRRGEVTPEAFPDRWMASEVSLAIAKQVAKQLERFGEPLRIIVISNDPALDLSELANWPTDNWSHVASLPSLCAMAEADVLITAISSFSKVAGIAGNAIVLAPKSFWPLEDWITYDSAGSFDVHELLKRLESRLQPA
jgi:hypothetical protein